MSAWLSLTQRHRFSIMYHFRHLLTRECYYRFLSKRKNQRRLWRLAKAYAFGSAQPRGPLE